ncbi:hypothetical protein WJX72_010748 [[Myrmecia] bisecta]|uniref:Uncharacterized protein n=1 Tax=[Myrmecia] bisecta TaxID=41462 RepID=A0AAW1PBS1_9CHLO
MLWVLDRLEGIEPHKSATPGTWGVVPVNLNASGAGDQQKVLTSLKWLGFRAPAISSIRINATHKDKKDDDAKLQYQAGYLPTLLGCMEWSENKPPLHMRFDGTFPNKLLNSAVFTSPRLLAPHLHKLVLSTQDTYYGSSLTADHLSSIAQLHQLRVLELTSGGLVSMASLVTVNLKQKRGLSGESLAHIGNALMALEFLMVNGTRSRMPEVVFDMI